MKKREIIIITVLSIALVISILYGIGLSASLDEEILTYNELVEEIEKKEKELKDITKDLNDNKEYYEELLNISEEYDELVDAVTDYKSEIIGLEDDIKEKEEKLRNLDGEIAKVKDEPIKVNPGVYHFGSDIETGRYKITAQDGYNGNIFFRGDNDFAETFGKGRYSIEEYTFYAEDGDQIELTIPVLLYPVE